MNALITRDPLRDIAQMSRDMERLFARVGTRAPLVWQPAADVIETPEGYEITLDVPGVDPAMMEIEMNDQTLIIRGERRHDDEAARVVLAERPTGRFERSFQLPSIIDTEAIRARHQHGTLIVEVPKAAAVLPRRIEIAED